MRLRGCNKLRNIGYSKTCLKRSRSKIGFQDQLSLNAGQKYYRMLQGGAFCNTCDIIKLPFVIRNFVLSIFECPLKVGFTVFTIPLLDY